MFNFSYIDRSSSDASRSNLNTKKQHNYCVRCIQNNVDLQKVQAKYTNLQEKYEKLMKENQLLRAQFRNFAVKFGKETQEAVNETKSCDICSAMLTSEQLKHHLCIDQKAFSCDYCSSTFKSTIEFSEHLASHSELEYHKCNNCYIAFPTAQLLKLHENSKLAHPIAFMDDLDESVMDKRNFCNQQCWT